VVITKAPGAVVPTGYAKTFASVAAKTTPGASCTIAVVYKSGRSKAADLGPKKASAAGAVGWTWRIGTNTSKGVWPVTVTCGAASAKTVVTVK
jgi:micrococcal nuclease